MTGVPRDHARPLLVRRPRIVAVAGVTQQVLQHRRGGRFQRQPGQPDAGLTRVDKAKHHRSQLVQCLGWARVAGVANHHRRHPRKQIFLSGPHRVAASRAVAPLVVRQAIGARIVRHSEVEAIGDEPHAIFRTDAFVVVAVPKQASALAAKRQSSWLGVVLIIMDSISTPFAKSRRRCATGKLRGDLAAVPANRAGTAVACYSMVGAELA